MKLNKIITFLIATIQSSCALIYDPTQYTGLPEKLPSSYESLYAPYLDCLSGLIDHSKSPVDVLIGGFEDKTISPRALGTGFLSFGGQFMVRTSLARLWPQVVASTPSAYTPERETILIKAAFTQLGRIPVSVALAGSARLPYGIDITVSHDTNLDFIVLDAEVADVSGRMISGIGVALLVPVYNSTTDTSVLYEGIGGDYAAGAAGTVKTIGRRHAAQRLLIDAALYELLGRYFNIDTTACLDIDTHLVRQYADEYWRMFDKSRIESIQRLLGERGYNVGAIDGVLGSRTRRAIREYESSNGHHLTGQVTAVLYVNLKMI